MTERSMERARILDSVQAVVTEALHGLPVRVFLFGSWARGEERPASDIDVAVEPLTDLPRGTLARLRETLEEAPIPYRVDLVDLSSADKALHDRIHQEGIPWIG